jgi:hypothetical protein
MEVCDLILSTHESTKAEMHRFIQHPNIDTFNVFVMRTIAHSLSFTFNHCSGFMFPSA